MQSVMIVVLGIAGMTFGWFVYSKFIAQKIYKLDPDFVTPAHEFNDGIDYCPTNKYVLWGHHFTSVAGAAPIVGPAIAVYWGWVPAVLWVTLGTVFLPAFTISARSGPVPETRASPSAHCRRKSSAGGHARFS